MMDVGGTTTDVGSVVDGEIATDARGVVKGVPISFPMSNVHSAGVGGSSVIGVSDGRIKVGPHSVGAAPGPACFGLGGQEATITDVNLLLGVLDPATYLDGELRLDADRARTVITETVAAPLGISLEEALIRMEAAYFEAMAGVIRHLVRDDTTLAAFGGAGPMSACGAARLAGARRVLIPRMAAVFSAFGISFSDIGKSYEVGVPEPTAEAATATYDDMVVRAERDMFQEGYELADCSTSWLITVETGDGRPVDVRSYRRGDPVEAGDHQVSLRLDVAASLPHPTLVEAAEVTTREAVAHGTRAVRAGADQVDTVSVYLLDDQEPGAGAAGPAIVEGPFFTARVPAGWRLDVTSNGDLILTDTHAGTDTP
jgi:N-methylhydantoinase A/oxoprolinase/acetone carboxylase beta subunit